MSRSTNLWWKIVLWVAVVLATLGFLYLVRRILLPFVLAFVICVLLEPTIQRLRRRGMSRASSVGIITGVFFVSVSAALVWVAPRITDQLGSFQKSLESVTEQLKVGEQETVFTRWNPVERANTTQTTNPIDRVLEQFEDPLTRVGIPASRQALIEQYVDPRRQQIAASVKNFFNGFLGLVVSASSEIFLLLFTPLFVVFMLMDFERLKIKSATWIPTSIRAETITLVRDIGNVFVNYLRGVTTALTLYAVIMAIVLSLLGVPYAFLFALLVAALYMIPYIGGVISAVSILVATGLNGVSGNFMFGFADPWTYGLVTAGIFYGVSVLFDQFIFPKIMGNAIGLNMLVSMFVVLAGGALFGIVGMVLAFPVAGSVKVILERVLQVTTNTSVENLRLPATPLRHRSTVEI